MARVRRSPKVSVDITEGIIRNSVTADSSHCMIAEALQKAVPSAHAIAVDVQTIRFSDPKKRLRYVYLTPRIAQVPLVQFDQGIMPEPFKFVLRGGHVVSMARPRSAKANPQSAKKPIWDDKTMAGIKAAKKASMNRAKAVAQGLAKAGLVNRKSAGDGSHQLERVGGKTPPTTAFANRRSFGLRALGRPTP